MNRLEDNEYFKAIENGDKQAESAGEIAAYHYWKKACLWNRAEFEVDGSIWDDNMADFCATLRKASINTFVYTNTATDNIRALHSFDKEGYKLDGLCTTLSEKKGETQGIRLTAQ